MYESLVNKTLKGALFAAAISSGALGQTVDDTVLKHSTTHNGQQSSNVLTGSYAVHNKSDVMYYGPNIPVESLLYARNESRPLRYREIAGMIALPFLIAGSLLWIYRDTNKRTGVSISAREMLTGRR